MATELEALIIEQRKDQQRGTRITPERHVAVSLDRKLQGDQTLADLVGTDGFIRIQRDPNWDGCHVHGFTECKINDRGELVCNACTRERSRQRRRGHGIKPKPKRVCNHSAEFLYPRTDRPNQLRCRMCDRERNLANYYRKKLSPNTTDRSTEVKDAESRR